MGDIKPWYLSKSIWGILIAFVGFISQKLFNTVIPDISSEIVQIIGLAIATYGRIVAEKVIK